MAKKNATVAETYTLPSKGILYGEEFGSEVTIRSMTTFEEKMRLGNQGFWKTMSDILDAVVTAPEGFQTRSMTLFDFYFLMYKMRAVSYGPTYKVRVRCPHCGHEEIIKVNLDELKINYLDEKFKEPFEIGPLPRSGDTLGCKFLRVSDSMNIDKRSREILDKHPDYKGDPSYILNRAAQIVSINGETKTPIEIEIYVEQMAAMDSAYFSQVYNKITDDIGLEMVCSGTCSACGTELRSALPLNSEFFRPTYDI